MHQLLLFFLWSTLAAASADEATHHPGRKMMRTEIRSEGDLHEEESTGFGIAKVHGHLIHVQVPSSTGDCQWSEWSEWTPCDTTCGCEEGSQSTRSRRLATADPVLAETCGSTQEARACGALPCPVDCQWDEWQGWSECSVTCGVGQKFNKRTSIQAQYGGLACAGAFEKLSDCLLANCSGECTWTEWSDWHGCEATCGGSRETRDRTILTFADDGKTCDSPCNQMRECGQGECPIDCVLGDWTSWGSCSASCGEGRNRRTRPVEQQMAHGGGACDTREEYGTCNNGECSSICAFSDWTEWGECSVSCGTGTSTRSKNISDASIKAGLDCSGKLGAEPQQEAVCCEASCSDDCYIADWSAWTPCSATCGAGFTERYRIVHQPSEGGRACPLGSGTYESRRCSVQVTCPRDCKWDDWLPWSCCSASCGNGKSARDRTVLLEAQGGGLSCEGSGEQERACNDATCPSDCQWGLWSDWFSCTSSCGTGNQSRTRAVQKVASSGGESCQGGSEDWQTCESEACPVDCKWEDWSSWGECSSSCGTGKHSRSRASNDASSGGLECVGESKGTKDCEDLPSCPKDCIWDVWSDWGHCSATCGAGTERKVRLRKSYESNGGKICQGAEDDERLCSLAACPRDCQLGSWEAWTTCTASCGVGARSRSRAITQHERNGGAACLNSTSGNSSRYEVTGCFLGHCSRDCLWSLWSPWTVCTKSCGGGYTSRDRTELVPSAHGGRACDGSAHEETICSPHPCPVDCTWDEWADWSTCSTTCGGGERSRERHVIKAAEHGGVDCSGLAKEKDLCNTLNCPLNCQWSTWTNWSPCSVTCNGGETHRSRRKVVLEQYDGLPCLGQAAESHTCMSEGCPLDCEWGPWSKWTACSATCAGGSIKRVRDISVHKKNNGSDCLGFFEESADCNNNPCPGSCVWSDWCDWGDCPASCGGAKKESTRARLQEASAGGDPCVGNSTREEICNTHKCPVDCQLQEWTDWSACSVSCGTGVKVRSRVKTQEREGGKACDGQLSEVKDCPNTENDAFCPSTTTTTANIVYVAASDGQDIVAAAKAAGVAHLLNLTHDDDTKKQSDSGLKVADDAAKKQSDDAVQNKSKSTAEPQPCAKDKPLKEALESYPSEDTKYLVNAMATLKKAHEQANEKAMEPGAKGHKVSDVITHVKLYTTNADEFVTSVAANAAMKQAMSKLLSVDEKNIKVDMLLEGAFMTPTWKKEEQGNVKADITVQIFENDNIGEPELLAEGMSKSLTAERVTAAITTKLAEKELGEKFQVHATYMSVSQQ